MTYKTFSRVKRPAGLALLVILLLASSLTLAAENANSTHFYFAQITDIHLGQPGNLANTLRIVKSINNLPMKIECTVLTGDILHHPRLGDDVYNDGMGALKMLNVPLHLLPGNHDVPNGDNNKFAQESFQNRFGPLSSKAEYQGVVFIMVYTEPLRVLENKTGYDTLAWLEKALSETKGKPVIIFTHVPGVEDFYRNEFHPGWPKENFEKWEKLINSYDVKAVIAGHFHREELHWIGKVPLYVSSLAAVHKNRPSTYRVYEYKDGLIGYRTIYFD